MVVTQWRETRPTRTDRVGIVRAVLPLVGLAVGLLAGFLLFAPVGPPDPTDDVRALHEEWVRAWTARDVAAVHALLIRDPGWGAQPVPADDAFLRDEVESFDATPVGTPVVATHIRPGYGTEYQVAQVWQEQSGEGLEQAVAVYRVVPEDGVLRVYAATEGYWMGGL